MKTYFITEFGAKVSDALQTRQIQETIDTCFREGGGKVVIPAGVFRTGGLRLRSNVTLYLESGAILEGSKDPDDYADYIHDTLEPIVEPDEPDPRRSVYPFSRWNNAIIRAIDAKNISIIGEKGSYINGVNCYDPEGEEIYRGPHAINIQRCENVHLEGYTIIRSANWAHAIFITNNIVARNLTVYGGHDGIDVRTCDDVLIEDCTFITGDDCVAGFDNNRVVVRGCIFNSACSALRFGGHDVLVENCKSIGLADYGFRGHLSREAKAANELPDVNCRHRMHHFFQYYFDFIAEIRKTPGNIVIRNCEIADPRMLFILSFDGKHQWCCNRSLSSIRFEHCSVKGVDNPITIYGDEKEPLEFVLDDVQIEAAEGAENAAVMDALHYSRIVLEGMELKGFADPKVVIRSEGDVIQKESTPVRVERQCPDEFEVELNAPVAGT